MTGGTQITIKAEDAKDLEVISSLMQDATIRVGDLAYDDNSHQFACLANRFRWEKRGRKKVERIRSILRFEHVLKTSFKNIPVNTPAHILNFLSLDCIEGEGGAKSLILVFSGFATIRINVECLEGFLEDITNPWITKNTPEHSILKDN
jgi:hypothetical protein